MNKFLFKISYKGTNYSGLQRQTQNPNTIQEILENAVKENSKQNDFTVSLASRTDKGVHAKEQYLLFHFHQEVSSLVIKEIQKTLPSDINILEITKVDPSFNLQQQILGKTYEYKICFTPSTHQNDDTYYYHHEITPIFFQKYYKVFEGENDFRDFCVFGGRTPDTSKTIDHIELIENKESNTFIIRITGKGFLKYMIRFIVGSLILLEENKIAIEDIKSSLHREKTLPKNYKASARGLTLKEIHLKSSTFQGLSNL